MFFPERITGINANDARKKKFNAFKSRKNNDKLSCSTDRTYEVKCKVDFTAKQLFSMKGIEGTLVEMVTNKGAFGNNKDKGYIKRIECCGWGGDSPFFILFGMSICNSTVVLLSQFTKLRKINS